LTAGACHERDRRRPSALDSQKKSFWLLFTLLGLGAFFLSFWWGVAETFAALVASWWIIYRSGIF
jgi:hypothetical protein